jgi:hypothetical protein
MGSARSEEQGPEQHWLLGTEGSRVDVNRRSCAGFAGFFLLRESSKTVRPPIDLDFSNAGQRLKGARTESQELARWNFPKPDS